MDQVARVVLALEAPDVAEEVLHFLDRSGRARVVATAADDRQLREAVTQCEPDAVVAEPSLVPEGLAAPLLALATRESVALLRSAVAAGAAGFYVWPGEREALLDGVGRCAADARVPAERRAVVVAVHGSRGAVGATFVATQLATSCRRLGESCVLIDTGLGSADVTFALGVASEDVRTIADLAPVASELTWEHLEGTLVHGAVLAPPIERLSEVDAAVVRAVVLATAETADVVVLHLGRDLDDLARWCLDEADLILEILTLDPAAFRASARTIARICPDGSDHRWRFVVNRSQRSELTVADVERAFGVPASGIVPADGAVPKAMDRGRPLAPRGRAARAVARLAVLLREPAAADRAS